MSEGERERKVLVGGTAQRHTHSVSVPPHKQVRLQIKTLTNDHPTPLSHPSHLLSPPPPSYPTSSWEHRHATHRQMQASYNTTNAIQTSRSHVQRATEHHTARTCLSCSSSSSRTTASRSSQCRGSAVIRVSVVVSGGVVVGWWLRPLSRSSTKPTDCLSTQ